MLSKFRMKLVDYTDSLVNQVDLKAEILLLEQRPNETAINGKRQMFIDAIKQVEAFNLKHVESLDLTGISAELLTDEIGVNELIFKQFCFILDQQDLDLNHLSKEDATFGCLIVVGKFLSNQSLNCYRELLKFRYTDASPASFEPNVLAESNCLFYLKPKTGKIVSFVYF
jgi:hypothetical protein